MTPTVRRPPAWRLYLYVLAPSLVVVTLVGALAIGSVEVLGAVRAYVGGESLWSKARNEAVQHLLDYAASHDPHDFAQFEHALTIPLGDRRAREALSQPEPDRDAARQGFLAGGNHPDDIHGMILLLVHFGQQALFRPSLDAWVEGDQLIAQLQAVAREMHELVLRDGPRADVRGLLGRVRAINTSLFHAEITFSRNLGHASRLTEGLLITATGLTAAALSLIGYLMARTGLKRQHIYQRDLANANRRWELAVVGAELGLFELDRHANEVTLDARAAAMYGLTKAQVTVPVRDILSRIAPQDRRRAEHQASRAMKERRFFRLTVQVVLPDGQSRYLETLGSPPDNGDEALARLIGVVRDVTLDKRRDQLAMERDAAERVAASQRHFLSRLSHELRTPLNAILGFAQLLTMDREHGLPPTQRQQVAWILDAGQQLLALVEDVLDLSKVEAGEISMTLQDCDLGAVLNNSLVLIESARQQHGVTIVNQVSDATPHVVADPARLQQVLVNLLTNGCKYNRPGGQVRIDAQVDGDMVRIDIADNGIGLSPEDAAELFQPFRRVSAVSARIEGSGLGLYIVRQLVERMGGTVTLQSQPGEGSCFSVHLPRANSVA